MGRVEFTANYEDLATASGFQFKFICESCGNGYQSSWKANPTGIAGSVLRTAGGLLGGIFGRAASSSYEIQQAIGGPAHDSALAEATAEIKPLFVQCKRCGQWVCRDDSPQDPQNAIAALDFNVNDPHTAFLFSVELLGGESRFKRKLSK